MAPFLRIFFIIASLLFMGFIIFLVRRERILLKYSLAWLTLGVLGLVAAIFPDWVFALSNLLAFEKPVNFILFICVFFLMAVMFVFAAIISRQSVYIKELVQEVSLLKNELACIRSRGDNDITQKV